MDDGFDLCMALPNEERPRKSDQNETFIVHIQYSDTCKQEYTSGYEELESTLLTTFLTAEYPEKTWAKC